MWEAKCMTYLMSRNKSDKFSHDLVIKFNTTCIRVSSCRLDEEPVPKQVHYVMIPSNITFQDLSGSWIMNVWSISILNRRRKIPDHGISNIFRAKFRVLFR